MAAGIGLGGYAYLFGCGERCGKQLAPPAFQLTVIAALSPLLRRYSGEPGRAIIDVHVVGRLLQFCGLVTDTKQAKRFLVSGFVQGVGFRYFAENSAKRLGICGYVRNLRDGRVEAYAIGTPQQLANFRLALENGPGAANVMKVTEEGDTIHPQYANSFSITYDS